MSKNIVVYFSVSGMTGKVAGMVGEIVGAELCRIVPAVPYTIEDIDYTNENARSTVEMKDLACRPAIGSELPDLSGCDTIYLGFPVWWGREPSVIDTFLEAAALEGKTIVPFCTSAGSDIEGAVARITELVKGKAAVANAKRLAADASMDDVKAWLCK